MKYLSKYLAFTYIAIQQSIAERGIIIGRLGFYGIVLLVFSRVWVIASERFPTLQPVDNIWYIAITQWILMSVPHLHLEIEKDVRSGNIAYLLSRPISYIWMRLFEGLGILIIRILINGFAGFLFAVILTRSLPTHPWNLLFALPLGLLAGIVIMIYNSTIGLSSFWIIDVNPVYWIWSKCIFILGGLIFPLSLYPTWLQFLAYCTPFYILLYSPAKSAIEGNILLVFKTFILQLIWGGVGLFLLTTLYNRGQKILNITGG